MLESQAAAAAAATSVMKTEDMEVSCKAEPTAAAEVGGNLTCRRQHHLVVFCSSAAMARRWGLSERNVAHRAALFEDPMMISPVMSRKFRRWFVPRYVACTTVLAWFSPPSSIRSYWPDAARFTQPRRRENSKDEEGEDREVDISSTGSSSRRSRDRSCCCSVVKTTDGG